MQLYISIYDWEKTSTSFAVRYIDFYCIDFFSRLCPQFYGFYSQFSWLFHVPAWAADFTLPWRAFSRPTACRPRPPPGRAAPPAGFDLRRRRTTTPRFIQVSRGGHTAAAAPALCNGRGLRRWNMGGLSVILHAEGYFCGGSVLKKNVFEFVVCVKYMRKRENKCNRWITD